MRGDFSAQRAPGRWSKALAKARWLSVTARLALRELGRSRRRTLATMTGAVLALVLVLTSVGMITSMRTAIEAHFNEVQLNDAAVAVAPESAGTDSDLRAVSGVADVEPVTQAAVTVSDGEDSYSTSLTGYRPDTSMHGFRGEAGEDLRLPSEGILAGKSIVDELDVEVGDTMVVRAPSGHEREARLAGLLDEPMGTALYGTRDTVRELTGLGANSYELRFDDGVSDAERDDLRAEISDLDGVVGYTDTQALRRQIDKFLNLFWIFTGVMLVLGGILALTVVYVTMTVNIAERTSELATLRAAGVSLRRIGSLLAVENLTATLIAIPAGLVLGALAGAEALRSFESDMFSVGLDLGWQTPLAAAAAVLAASLVSQIPAVRMVGRLDLATVVRERAQ